MADGQDHGIVGTDNHVPIYLPNSSFRVWALHEVYQGQEGKDKFVPKVNDLVVDMATGLLYKCVSINLTTMVAKLESFDVTDSSTSSDFENMLVGPGPKGHEESIRLYIDKSEFPHLCAVDEYYTIGAVSATYARVFKGSVTEGNQTVIGFMKDQNGGFLGNDIPLELVSISNQQNIATKGVVPFYTNYDLKNNDLATIIFYSNEGHVVSMRPLAVMESGFIRAGAADIKYIENIELDSPYDSISEPGVIIFPVNLPFNASHLHGIVNYSDGTQAKYAVDGMKFNVLGISDYISSIPNQEFDITLTYTLAPNEAVYGKVIGEVPVITQSYKLRTSQVNKIWTVKLYCFPVWVNANIGYRLAWFLFNLDRATFYRVDSLISINDTGSAFLTTGYGLNQLLSVTIDLEQVSSIYSQYNHVQVFNIELLKQGTEPITNWRVSDYNANNKFGNNLQVKCQIVNQNLKYLKIDSGYTDFSIWLDNVFYKINPIYNSFTETEAPEPTHVFLSTDESINDIEISLLNWQDTITYTQPITPNGTMFFRFVKRIGSDDLQLGMAAMPIKQVSSI